MWIKQTTIVRKARRKAGRKVVAGGPAEEVGACRNGRAKKKTSKDRSANFLFSLLRRCLEPSSSTPPEEKRRRLTSACAVFLVRKRETSLAGQSTAQHTAEAAAGGGVVFRRAYEQAKRKETDSCFFCCRGLCSKVGKAKGAVVIFCYGGDFLLREHA